MGFFGFFGRKSQALLMSAEVDGLIGQEGRVGGVAAKTKDGQLTIRADLTIGADGRHSSVRREAGFVPLDIGAPMDVLWFKLSRRTTDAGGLLGRIDAGQILVPVRLSGHKNRGCDENAGETLRRAKGTETSGCACGTGGMLTVAEETLKA
jgi:2-polyprenyl-6-methoxyphenol hydroxylase-like FAD-dependent oxidoreductase